MARMVAPAGALITAVLGRLAIETALTNVGRRLAPSFALNPHQTNDRNSRSNADSIGMSSTGARSTSAPTSPRASQPASAASAA